MTCNEEFFKKEYETLITKSYAKNIIEGKYPDIDFYGYTASTDGKFHIDKKKHLMKVPCGDGLYETYQKTILAIKMLDALEIKYDWILKTNTSTWINAQILDRFVKEIPVYEKTKIFTGKIYSSEDSCGPDEYDYYGLGKYILISDFWADVLKQNPAEEYRKYNRNTKVNPEHEVIYNVDDNAIGFVVNTFCELNYVDKHSVWKYFDTPTSEMINYYMKYIAVSVRNYNEDQRDRELIYLEELSTKEKTIDFSDISAGSVYAMLTSVQKISLVDFKFDVGVDVSADNAQYYISNIDKFGGSVKGLFDYNNQKK